MSLPQSVKVRPLNLSSSSDSPPAPQVPPVRRLPYLKFNIQPQQQTQWCWAAVAVSVNLYYQSGSGWSQCKLVNQEFGRADCCQKGSSSACNQPYYPEIALQTLGNLLRWAASRATLNEAKTEIDKERPLCLGIGWSGGGGHAVALYGCRYEQIYIADPWYGRSLQYYNNFPGSYHGGGNWITTYWTTP